MYIEGALCYDIVGGSGAALACYVQFTFGLLCTVYFRGKGRVLLGFAVVRFPEWFEFFEFACDTVLCCNGT